MGKQFRSCDLNQAYLLPPSLQDWLPEGHLARFVADVVETLDLSAIYAKYEEGDGRGLAAYDPRMMLRLLIYAYCRGVPGSRRIEWATYEDVALRYLAADQHPNHSTIADFRQEHLASLSQLFVQVLKLCPRAGLVKLGHVALEGTKVKANASKHKAMSYARMEEAEKKLEEEVKALLAEAARVASPATASSRTARSIRMSALLSRHSPDSMPSGDFAKRGRTPPWPRTTIFSVALTVARRTLLVQIPVDRLSNGSVPETHKKLQGQSEQLVGRHWLAIEALAVALLAKGWEPLKPLRSGVVWSQEAAAKYIPGEEAVRILTGYGIATTCVAEC